MNGATTALMQFEQGDHESALATIARTVQAIEALEDLEDDTFDFERERSLQSLGDLARQIQSSRPVSKVERLEQQLQRAIADQEFERAAELRDRLLALKTKTVAP
jgi:protein-arginine kinase activator protein McsA